MKKILTRLYGMGDLMTTRWDGAPQLADVSVGWDGKVYFLFAGRIPPRIDGMFVDTAANTEYMAIVLTPSWESGEVTRVESVDFGKHRMNFHMLRSVPDGTYLLLGARCMYSRTKGPEKNAVFVDGAGRVVRELTFGDGIKDCAVRKDGVIFTSYFDEGIYGNYGWGDPIGKSGLCAWKPTGERIWEQDGGWRISDCYAMNTDEAGNLWYYYYTDFRLVCTDMKTSKVFDPEVSGAETLAVGDGGRLLIMDGGYHDRTLYAGRIRGGKIEGREPLTFVREDGTDVSAAWLVFGGAKAVLCTGDGQLAFADFGEAR